MTKKRTEVTRLKSSVIGGAVALAIGISAALPGAVDSRSIEGRGYANHSEIDPGGYVNLETGKIEYKLPGIATRYLWNLPQRTLSVNGKTLSEPAMMMNGTLYLLMNVAKDMTGTLLLVHGLADDNVHVQHSWLYVDALVQAGKQFEMQMYVDDNHSIRKTANKEHLHKRILLFLEKNL